MLEINAGIIWVIINLIVLYIVFKKFLFDRIMNVIEKRNQMINEQFDTAKEKQEAADALKKEYEDSLQNAREESKQIIQTAKENGQKEYNRIIEEANDKSLQIIEQANTAAQNDREKALEDARSEIAELAVMAAAKIVADSAGSQIDASLYNDFFAKAGKQHDINSN